MGIAMEGGIMGMIIHTAVSLAEIKAEADCKAHPLRLRCSSDDFSDGMNDTEQQPDEEGKSSDETAYD